MNAPEKVPVATIPPEPVPPGHALVNAACARDPQAWQEIVRRYRGMVGKVARSYRLSDADTADVLQNTWLRALERREHLHGICCAARPCARAEYYPGRGDPRR